MKRTKTQSNVAVIILNHSLICSLFIVVFFVHDILRFMNEYTGRKNLVFPVCVSGELNLDLIIIFTENEFKFTSRQYISLFFYRINRTIYQHSRAGNSWLSLSFLVIDRDYFAMDFHLKTVENCFVVDEKQIPIFGRQNHFCVPINISAHSILAMCSFLVFISTVLV